MYINLKFRKKTSTNDCSGMPEQKFIKQEEITLWTGIIGNGSMHNGDGTIGHGLTMDITKGLSICDRTCHASIAHLDPKASEVEEGRSSLIHRCLRCREKWREKGKMAVYNLWLRRM